MCNRTEHTTHTHTNGRERSHGRESLAVRRQLSCEWQRSYTHVGRLHEVCAVANVMCCAVGLQLHASSHQPSIAHLEFDGRCVGLSTTMWCSAVHFYFLYVFFLFISVFCLLYCSGIVFYIVYFILCYFHSMYFYPIKLHTTSDETLSVLFRVLRFFVVLLSLSLSWYFCVACQAQHMRRAHALNI